MSCLASLKTAKIWAERLAQCERSNAPVAQAYPGRRFALPWAILFCPFGADGSGAGQRPEARGGRREGTAKQPENFGAIISWYQMTQNAGTVPGYFYWSFRNRPIQQTGVLHLKECKMDVFFVTLQKSEDEYSPTTMYEDYLISHDLFHWQTMSNT